MLDLVIEGLAKGIKEAKERSTYYANVKDGRITSIDVGIEDVLVPIETAEFILSSLCELKRKKIKELKRYKETATGYQDTGDAKITETNFDKLAGKNGELVEERKRQILKGAFEIISEHYKDKPKMEAIATIFGKKMGEEFKIRVGAADFTAQFREQGLAVLPGYDGRYQYSGGILITLLVGEAVIINE